MVERLPFTLGPGRVHQLGDGFCVRFNRNALKSVVFLGYPDRTAGPAGITCEGTGFLLMYDGAFYLVTARHVAEKLGDTGFTTRVNTIDGGSRNVEPEGNVTWVFHPDPSVDVAVVGFQVSRAAGYDFLYLDEILLIKEDRENVDVIEIGDLCYTIGLWRLLEGKGRNLPVVHTGHIARLPGSEKIPVRDRARPGKRTMVDGYLVEAQTLSGLSGAPVFIRPSVLLGLSAKAEGADREERLKLIAYKEEVALLGIWQAAWDAPADEVVAADRGGPMTVPVGMGIVVPTSRIVEILELPFLREKRDAIREAQELAGAAEPQSIGSKAGHAKQAPEVPRVEEVAEASNANPSHREDFTRLVGAASRKKPQGE